MVFEIRALMHVKAPPERQRRRPRGISERLSSAASAFFAGRDHFEELVPRGRQRRHRARTFRPLDVPIFVKALLGAHNWVGVWYKPDGRLNGAQIADMIADTMLRGVLA